MFAPCLLGCRGTNQQRPVPGGTEIAGVADETARPGIIRLYANAEQRTLNPRVRGSSPWRRTRKSPGQSHSRRWLWCARDRPGSNASSNRGHSLVLVVPQGAGRLIGRLPRDLRRDIAIGVHRERDLAVPEDLHHLAGRNVLSQQQAGRRVTEIMEPGSVAGRPSCHPAYQCPGCLPSARPLAICAADSLSELKLCRRRRLITPAAPHKTMRGTTI